MAARMPGCEAMRPGRPLAFNQAISRRRDAEALCQFLRLGLREG
jgi:hypothetical protein